MKLHDFIEKFIARNTMIRLWKNNDNTSRLMLTDEAVMEWETLRIKELSEIEVVCVTDIVCERDREAVNIVVDTDLGREDVIKLFRDYEKKRESERKYQCEGCVQKNIERGLRHNEHNRRNKRHGKAYGN